MSSLKFACASWIIPTILIMLGATGCKGSDKGENDPTGGDASAETFNGGTNVGDDSMPDGSMSDDSMPDGSMSDDSMPDDSMPDDSMPDGSMPDDSMPDDSMPDGSMADDDGPPASFAGYEVVTSSIVDGNDGVGEQARDVAFDSQGNFIMVGGTSASNYPTTNGAYDTNFSGPDSSGIGTGGDWDAFVSKFDRQGALIWSTFLGNGNYDRAYAVEVGPDDDVFVGGRAGPGFPTTAGVHQPNFAGDDDPNTLYGQQDGFVTRLSGATGDIVWSTYVGESGHGLLRDIDVDGSGNVYVAMTGGNGSVDAEEWGPNTTVQGRGGFYGKLSSDGTRMLFGNYMTGSSNAIDDGGNPSVRVAPDGSVYFLTWTDSSDFGCITNNAMDTSFHGDVDLVLARFEADNTLAWCTFIGGDGQEVVETHGLEIDINGNAVVAVSTQSSDLPTPGGYQQSHGGDWDTYLAIVAKDGSEILSATYFGASGVEFTEGVAIASNGDIVISGAVSGAVPPSTSGALQSQIQGSRDAMIARFSADLSELLYFSPYGGGVTEALRGIDASPNGDIVAVGVTESDDYPTKNGYDSGAKSGNSANIFTLLAPLP